MAVWGVLISERQSKTTPKAKAWKACVHSLIIIFLDYYYYPWNCGPLYFYLYLKRGQDYNDLSSLKSTRSFCDSAVSYLNDRIVQCVQQWDHIHEGFRFKNLSVEKQFTCKICFGKTNLQTKQESVEQKWKATFGSVASFKPFLLFTSPSLPWPFLSMPSLAELKRHNMIYFLSLMRSSSNSAFKCTVAIKTLWLLQDDKLDKPKLVRLVITLFALSSEVTCCLASKQLSSSLSTSRIKKVPLEGLLSSFFWRVHRSFPAELWDRRLFVTGP